MASTGLLGFNPYGGGFQFDPSSKIVNLAVQLNQKEQAKKDALEKYFMDYEKSVNPAGLSKGESDIFLKKYNDNKQFWMKNKEAILNPSKYGYDAQSQYMANLKDQMGYINEAKQANEQRKAFNNFIAKAKAEGKDISDNVLDITTNAAKPVGAGYVAPDLSSIQVYDPHDDISFIDKTWKGLPLNKDIITEKEIIKGKPTGKERDVLVEYVTPEVAKNYEQRARGFYRNNLGTQEQYNLLFKDEYFKKQLNPTFQKYFNRNISNPEDLVVAYGLSTKQEKREPKSSFDYSKATYMKMNRDMINASKDKNGTFNPNIAIDNLYEGGTPNTYTIGGQTIEGKDIGLPTELEDKYFDKVDGILVRPDKIVMSKDKNKLYFIDFTGQKTKSGHDIIDKSRTRVIDVNSDLSPTLGKTYGGLNWSREFLSRPPQPNPQGKSKEQKNTSQGKVR